MNEWWTAPPSLVADQPQLELERDLVPGTLHVEEEDVPIEILGYPT